METATADIIETEEETPPVTQQDLVEASKAVYDAVQNTLRDHTEQLQKQLTAELRDILRPLRKQVEDLQKQLQGQSDAFQKQLQQTNDDALRREQAQKDFYEKALQRQGEHLVKSLGTADGVSTNVGDVVASYGKLLEDNGNRRLADLRKELGDGLAELQRDTLSKFTDLERGTQARVDEMLTFLRALPTPQVVVTDGAFNIHVPQLAAPMVQVTVPEVAPVVNVTVPTQPVPEVIVEVPQPPEVVVQVPQPRLVRKTFEYDTHNRPISIIEEEVGDAPS